MHLLPTHHFVPTSNLINISSHSISQSNQIASLLRDFDTIRDCSVSLSNLLCFAERSDHNAGTDGLVPVLVGVLGAGDCLNLVVRVLDLIRAEIGDREELVDLILKRNRNCLNSLTLVLRRGTAESRSAAARLLEFVAINAESKLAIAENEGIVLELIGLIGADEDPRVIESALSCLISISMVKHVKIKLVRLGAIRSLTKLLLLRRRSSSVGVTEKVLKLLAAAAAVEEGRSEMCENGGECVGGIVRKVMKVSSAVTALWCVCFLFREERATEAKGAEKILLLIQSYCPAPVKLMAQDLQAQFKILVVVLRYQHFPHYALLNLNQILTK